MNVKHCARCKSIYDLSDKPYNTNDSYMCRKCNSWRAREYRKTSKGKLAYSNIRKRQALKFAEKTAARMAVYGAISKGILIKPIQCPKCQQVCNLDAHHEDYSKPLEVIWVCRRCHSDIHRRT